MKFAVHALFYGWAGALLVLGGAGIVTGRWELERLFAVPLDAMPPEAQAAFLNQYRFLKAAEFGVGALALAFRHDVFAVRSVNRLVLGVGGVAAVARLLSLALDGWPPGPMVGVVAFEVVAVAAVFVYTRPVRSP